MDPGADDEAAMAQMMGFSAFGATQNKKRKYNPNADAAMGAQPRQARTPASGASTGSNATPLGQAQRRAADHGAEEATATNADEIDLNMESDSAPNTADPPAHGDASFPSLPSVRPAGLPERPTASIGFPQPPFSQRLLDQKRHDGKLDDASRNPWYEGYYDPSSNENPWDRLEKAMGLPSKGTWIPRTNPPTSAAIPS